MLSNTGKAAELSYNARNALNDALKLLNAWNFVRTLGIQHQDYKTDGDRHALMLMEKAARLLNEAIEAMKVT